MLLSERHSSSDFIYNYELKDNKFRYIKTRYFYYDFFSWLKEVFLPQGYPDSVSNDYLEYQLWDTIQALSSTITSTIANQAILKGYGVGNANASVIAASYTWIYKNGTGLIGKITFAYWKGTSLDSDCKKWRLVADVVNDLCICTQIFTSLLPSVLFTPLICLTSIGESIVGVAGGSTRAAMTQHQALRDNMADVSAKDGSQECFSNLIGLMLNLLVVYLIGDNFIIMYLVLFCLIGVHMYSNWRAVRSLNMHTLNQTRLHFVTRTWLQRHEIPTLEAANQKEPVCWNFTRPCIKRVSIGCSVSMLPPIKLHQLSNSYALFENERYVILLSLSIIKTTKKYEGSAWILLKEGCNDQDQLKSVFNVEVIDYMASGTFTNVHNQNIGDNPFTSGISSIEDLEMLGITKSLQMTNQLFPKYLEALQTKAISKWSVTPLLLGANEWRFNNIKID